MSSALGQLVALDQYPLDQLESSRYQTVVTEARDGLRSVGCAVVKDFIRADAVALMGDEINARKSTTHYSNESINPYFHMTASSDYPLRHPVNTFIERTSGFIPGDSWEPTTANRRLFEHPLLASSRRPIARLGNEHCVLTLRCRSLLSRCTK